MLNGEPSVEAVATIFEPRIAHHRNFVPASVPRVRVAL
jgi:hypothetical protein